MSKQYIPVPEDKELAALAAIVPAMEALDEAARQRIIHYLADRYER